MAETIMASGPWELFQAQEKPAAGGGHGPWEMFTPNAPQAAAVNPFNRVQGADVSYGQPLESAPPNPSKTDLPGEFRAAAGGPVTDRIASAIQAYAPSMLGGTGRNYRANLDINRRETAEAQTAHPADALAGNIASILPYMAIPGFGAGGGLAARTLGGAATGAAIGGVQGAASSPDWRNLGQTASDAAQGALAGGAVGGAAPLAGSALGRAITPFRPSANRTAMTATLNEAGVPVSAGQSVGSPGLQGLERAGGNVFPANQNQAFTEALMKQGGIPAKDVTQKSVAAAKEAIGNQFETLGGRNTVMIDAGLVNDLGAAAANYKRLGGKSSGVEDAVNDLLHQNEPTIAGDVYNSLRSGFGKDAQTLRKSDPPQADAYRKIQGALDSAMDRSIAANNPDDLGAFREVRRQYGNFQDTSNSASKLTGNNAVEGTIPPSRMQADLRTRGRSGSYAAGQGDLAGLTRAGAGILTQAPAGPARSFMESALLHALTAGAGAGYGGYHGGVPGAVEYGALGAIAPRLTGGIVRAPVVQRYLANQLAPGLGQSPAIGALARGAAAAWPNWLRGMSGQRQ